MKRINSEYMPYVGRRGRAASRDVMESVHKPVSTCTPPVTCLPTLHRSMSVMASTPSTLPAPASGHCSPKLLLSSLPSPQQLQQLHRSLSSVARECASHNQCSMFTVDRLKETTYTFLFHLMCLYFGAL